MRGFIFAFVVMMSVSLGFSTLANAALIDNGGGLIYDSSTDLTWYQGPNTGVNWNQAYGWAQNLDAGGVTGWRLPSYPQTPPYSYDPIDAGLGELSQLWVSSLGNTLGSNYTNPGPFDPTVWFAGGYWTDDVYYNHLTTLAAIYGMGSGTVGAGTLGAGAFAFAVHDGNVGAPEPATTLLLSLGVMGLARVRRKCGK